MRKLSLPLFEAMELYDKSVAGLADELLRAKFQANRSEVSAEFTKYESKSSTQTWCSLPKAAHGHPEAIIVGNISKGEFVSLYDDGVVKSGGAPRHIYDQIMLAAHEECPYCGGMGEMGEEGELGTVDHFLPKARFPAYSVLPINLVPACWICNKGMGSNFPEDPNRQPLHPYLDGAHFFDQKWTTATVREEDPIVVDFDVDPPWDWEEKDRQRVLQHFKDCKLRKRYRSRVWQELSPLISQRKTSLKTLTSEEFRAHLLAAAGTPELPINGWKRTLYSALADADWFCQMDFE